MLVLVEQSKKNHTVAFLSICCCPCGKRFHVRKSGNRRRHPTVIPTAVFQNPQPTLLALLPLRFVCAYYVHRHAGPRSNSPHVATGLDRLSNIYLALPCVTRRTSRHPLRPSRGSMSASPLRVRIKICMITTNARLASQSYASTSIVSLHTVGYDAYNCDITSALTNE